MKNTATDILQTTLAFFQKPHFLRLFVGVFVAYMLALSALFMADYLHTGDDFVRAWDAIRHWSDGGRHLNDVGSYFMNVSIHHRDISPIPQLFSVIFLALATMMLVQIITEKLSLKACILAIPLGISPFFLQNLSYKFDCVFFCIALVWTLWPFLMYRRKGWYGAVALSTFLICCTYQATLSVFGMVFLWMLLQDLWEDISVPVLLKRALLTALSVGLVIVSYTYLERQLNDNLYTLNRSTLCVGLDECLKTAQDNFRTLWKSFFIEPWQGTLMEQMTVVCFAVFVLIVMIQAVRSATDDKIWDVLKAFLCGMVFLSPLVILIDPKVSLLVEIIVCLVHFGLLWGLLWINDTWWHYNMLRAGVRLGISVYIVGFMLLAIIVWTIFFKELVLSPRILVGVGVYGAIMLLFLTHTPLNQSLHKFFCFLGSLIVWMLVVFALRYGNLLFIQWEYDRYKLSKAEHIMAPYQYTNLIFAASPRAPAVLRRYEEYPFLRRLVLAPPLYWTNFYLGPAYSKCHLGDNVLEQTVIYKDNEMKIESLLLKTKHGDEKCMRVDIVQ